jgi:hypothetical protein
MWPFTKPAVDPEHQRLRDAHERNKQEAARKKAEVVAACPHDNTWIEPWEGDLGCLDCGLQVRE